jgi:hypothetical protein
MTSTNATQNELVNAAISRSGSRLLVTFVVLAATWRVLGLVWLEDSPLLSPDPGSKELGLLFAKGLMGLSLVGLGLLAFVRVRTQASGLFALSSIAAGIYLGGPLPVANELLQDGIWLTYFTVGAMLSSAALLHFMLIYPQPLIASKSLVGSTVLYVPVTAAVILAVGILALPSFSPLRGTLRGNFFTLENWQVRIFTSAALVLIPVRYVLAQPRDRRAFGLDLMVLGLCAGSLPWAIATAVEQIFPSLQIPGGLGSEPFELLFAFIPMGLCSALLHGSETELPSPKPGP